MNESRRGAIAQIVSATAGLLGHSSLERLAAQQPCAGGAAAGTLIGTLPLSRADGVIQPYGVKFSGPGLDRRLITDLSLLEHGRLITPNSLAFVRTECPPSVAQHRGPWQIKTSGLMARAGSLTAGALLKMARPMGAHLLECSPFMRTARNAPRRSSEANGITQLAPAVEPAELRAPGSMPLTSTAVAFPLTSSRESTSTSGTPSHSATLIKPKFAGLLLPERWKPEKPGKHRIFLRVPDQSIPQRRLDSGYYMREVTIP